MRTSLFRTKIVPAGIHCDVNAVPILILGIKLADRFQLLTDEIMLTILAQKIIDHLAVPSFPAGGRLLLTAPLRLYYEE